MINALLKGIFKLIIGLVTLLLKPIDIAIASVLPGLSSAFSGVANYLNIIGSGIGWGISATGLSSSTLSLLVAFFTFKLTLPVSFWLIKLAIKWYDKLKP